ncbi:MAG TPA: serine/threonine-protein kinase, partial [Planctomycetia bacterium]|nr:serine/threonine-protein kinase [Planctomycetia bacterium]
MQTGEGKSSSLRAPAAPASGGSSATPSAPDIDESPTRIQKSPGSLTASPDSLSEQARDLIGTELEHFELLDCIGVGGMGRVFRARDNRLDRLVALKVLSPELATDADLVRRFEQEAKASGRLDSPHFARAYFFGSAKGVYFIAMEFVEGENLRRRLQVEGRLDPGATLLLGMQIAAGLAHASSRGVVHRDIKPSNIILTPEGAAKLVDMGLARDFLQAKTEITQTNVTMGTLDYISPEQASDPRRVDVRSDIYSLGCTLYHAATGQPPFPEGTGLQKLLLHQNEPAPDPRAIVPDLPIELAELIREMMAKRPESRPQTAGELLARMRRIAADWGVAIPAMAATAEALAVKPWWHAPVQWLIPAAALVAGVFAYTALFPTPDIALPAPNVPTASSDAAVSANGSNGNAARKGAPERAVESAAVFVPAEENLREWIEKAEDGATLKLRGDRYVLEAAAAPAEERTQALFGLLATRNLTIEAANPRHYVQIALKSGAMGTLAAQAEVPRVLVGVRGKRTVLRRLRLEIPAAAKGVAVSCEAGGQVRLEDCIVEAPLDPKSTDEHVGLAVQGGSAFVGDTLFQGGDSAVRFLGGEPAHATISNSAFAEHRQAFRLEATGKASLTVTNSAILAGKNAPFQLLRPRESTVVAIDNAIAMLPMATAPRLLELAPNEAANVKIWTGRNNLYAAGLTLRAGAGDQEVATADRLKAWNVRDDGGRTVKEWPWAAPAEDLLAATDAAKL